MLPFHNPNPRIHPSFTPLSPTDYHSRVVATVLPAQHCGGSSHLGYLSGTTAVTAVAGVATFDTLSAYCYPGGSMTVQFEALLAGLDLSYRVTMQRTLVFRDCHDGEVRRCDTSQPLHLLIVTLILMLLNYFPIPRQQYPTLTHTPTPIRCSSTTSASRVPMARTPSATTPRPRAPLARRTPTDARAGSSTLPRGTGAPHPRPPSSSSVRWPRAAWVEVGLGV